MFLKKSESKWNVFIYFLTSLYSSGSGQSEKGIYNMCWEVNTHTHTHIYIYIYIYCYYNNDINYIFLSYTKCVIIDIDSQDINYGETMS